MLSDPPASVQRVLDAAAEVGLELRLVEYPEGTRTAAHAAAAVGCEVAQIVKSLVFALDGELVVALTSGANRVDPPALAALAGAASCDRADADAVREATGFAIGGVAPIGHRMPLRTFFDPALLDHDVVWAAAGTPRHVFPVAPDELRRASGAVVGDFVER